MGQNYIEVLPMEPWYLHGNETFKETNKIDKMTRGAQRHLQDDWPRRQCTVLAMMFTNNMNASINISEEINQHFAC